MTHFIFDRTFHPDEANQAFTVGKLLETGVYTYKPTDHHGPTLYYAAAPLQQAFGHHTTAQLDGTLLRCTPLVFAVAGLVFLYLAVLRLVRRATGLIGWKSFALPLLPVVLLGTAPLFVFYATDFIQEMLLVCFTLMMFWAGTGYFLPGKRLKRGTWALLFGIAAGLAFATKETCVLTFAAFFGAALPFLVSHFRRTRTLPFRTNDIVLGLMGGLLTAVILFSSFAQDWNGVYNAFVAAPLSYVHRAAGDAASDGAAWHVHPWWQHLQWLFLGNPPKNGHFDLTFANLKALFHFLCLLLPVGLWCAFGNRRDEAHRPLVIAFLGTSLFTALLLVFYSAIPYKTPWCTLQILVPFLVAISLGYYLAREAFLQLGLRRGKSPTACAWVTSLIFLVAFPASIIATEHLPGLTKINKTPDSPEIPYNYAHSSPEVRELADCVANAIAQTHNKARTESSSESAQHPFIAVALPATDTWPFPFYNRTLESITGYWTRFEDLIALEKNGCKPTVVIVPMAEGHLAQALFPYLKNTRRFYMRPGVRVRVFW